MYTKKTWFLPHHWSGFYPIDFPFNQSWHHCVWLSRSLQELDFGVQRTRNINKATSRSGQYIYYSIICLHVCIYIYIKTVRLHKSAHTYTCMCIYILKYVHIFLCTCAWTCTHPTNHILLHILYNYRMYLCIWQRKWTCCGHYTCTHAIILK